MSNDSTLIEEIQGKQAEIISDLEHLKNEDARYFDDIEAIQKHQREVAEEIENLRCKSLPQEILNKEAS
ncbi:MAG: hypothetical protein ABWZ66_00700 [Pyrinomonadaceae bacterium]